MPYDLMLDIVIAFLLIATIAYAFLLNKRLAGLRRDKQELENLAATFGQATLRAEESLGKLKIMASGLDAELDKAQALRDDLAFLTERGAAAADQLEDAVRKARKAGAVPGAKSGNMTDPVAVAEAAQRVKTQLAKGALSDNAQVGVEPRGVETRGVEPRSAEPRGVEPTDELPMPQGKREPQPPRRSAAQADDEIAAKSEAEKELLKALRAAR